MKPKTVKIITVICACLTALWAVVQTIKTAKAMSYWNTIWDNSGIILFSFFMCCMIFVFAKDYIDRKIPSSTVSLNEEDRARIELAISKSEEISNKIDSLSARIDKRLDDITDELLVHRLRHQIRFNLYYEKDTSNNINVMLFGKPYNMALEKQEIIKLVKDVVGSTDKAENIVNRYY